MTTVEQTPSLHNVQSLETRSPAEKQAPRTQRADITSPSAAVLSRVCLVLRSSAKQPLSPAQSQRCLHRHTQHWVSTQAGLQTSSWISPAGN